MLRLLLRRFKDAEKYQVEERIDLRSKYVFPTMRYAENSLTFHLNLRVMGILRQWINGHYASTLGQRNLEDIRSFLKEEVTAPETFKLIAREVIEKIDRLVNPCMPSSADRSLTLFLIALGQSSDIDERIATLPERLSDERYRLESR